MTQANMYHYTTEKGYKGILNTKTIKPSLRATNPNDARYGDGQYISDILPGSKRNGQLSRIFCGVPWLGYRFTHYVGFSTSGLKVHYTRQHVYVILGSKDLSVRITSHGLN